MGQGSLRCLALMCRTLFPLYGTILPSWGLTITAQYLFGGGGGGCVICKVLFVERCGQEFSHLDVSMGCWGHVSSFCSICPHPPLRIQ